MDKLIVPRRSLGRFRTCDVAFQYRAGAGFPGDVNRGHPASIQPCLIDINSPPTQYGQPVVVDATTQGVRPIGAADGALTTIWGTLCRPYPFQQSTTNLNYGEVNLGVAGVATPQPVDVMMGGYMIVPVVGSPLKGGLVYIWYTASSGGHVQGGFEAVASVGNTIALDIGRYSWNSPPDANGYAELRINF